MELPTTTRLQTLLRRHTLFPYMGGKYYIKEWIVSHFDYGKDCYVDLFGGSGIILFTKKPHKIEIFNDNDHLLINFFKVLQENEEKLVEELEKLPYSRWLYNEFRNSDWNELDNFEKAVRWFYVMRGSFSGKFGKGWSYGFTRNISKYFNSLKLFPLFRERLKNVYIDCRDYREIISGIKREKEKEIMIYADPPYIGVNYYKSEWSLKDHEEFANLMNSLECSIAISYYETEHIKKWYPEDRWKYHYKTIIKHSCGLTKNNPEDIRPSDVELLLTNYDTKLARASKRQTVLSSFIQDC